jgi:eukaryotic-like serine/threonine-protein kinase
VSETIRLAPGTIFATDYKVVRPLRTGGQGSLYVVEQLSTSKHRALKLMLPELVAQPTSRKRFELEAKIAARIQSDHVVETIASGVDATTGVPWLAMELLEGEDLGALLQKRRRLPAGEVLEIFSQLCHALGEAHKEGVVHRDLKPENIFLAASRRRGVPFMVKVLDFGIARVMAEAKTQSGATVTGLGTPMWMAPEQTMPGGRIEPMTDVWPIGLLAFRMLTGYLFWKAPYDPGASVMMLMAEAFMHPLPTASGRAADYKCAERIPAGFDAWMAKCVARDMDQRWADAAAAFEALEPILAAVGDAPPTSAARPSAPEARPSTPSKPATTGPGFRTWEGAPQLADSAVLSADEPPPASAEADEPPSISAPPPKSQPISRPSEAIPAPPKSRATLVVVVVATLLGIVIGVAIFSSKRPATTASASSSPATSASPIASEPAPSASEPILASAAASAEEPVDAGDLDAGDLDAGDLDAGDPDGGATAAWLSRRKKKLCKPVGKKCFGNDDCCDRLCRRWVCRANKALQDPYGGDQ